MESLATFYASHAGLRLAKSEAQLLQPILGSLLGEYLVQVDGPRCEGLIAQHRLKQHYFLFDQIAAKDFLQIKCDYHDLPLVPNDIDVMLLPHTLEAIEFPKVLLAQTYASLKPHGLVIILGFKCFYPRFSYAWVKSWLPAFRLKRWLKAQRFTVQQVKYGKKSFAIVAQKQVSYRPMNPAKAWARKAMLPGRGCAEPTGFGGTRSNRQNDSYEG